MDLGTQLGFVADGVYLNTAMFGLPPARAVDAGAAAARDWARGRVRLDAWAAPVEQARASLARLHGVRPNDVTLAGSVSSLVSSVAAGVPRGGTVLLGDDEFLSLTMPFDTCAAAGRLVVQRVERTRLIESVAGMTPSWVAASLVRPQDGQLLDERALLSTARETGTRVLFDVSQAGWMPLASVRADVLVGAGHKWLMGPHGTAFMVSTPSARDVLSPINAGWTARADLELPPWGAQACAQSARRFDQSPAFLNWVVQAASLEAVEEIGVAAIAAHDLALATRLADGLGIAPPETPIVTVPAGPRVSRSLTSHGVQHTAREGLIRLSTHLCNDGEDIEAVLRALT